MSVICAPKVGIQMRNGEWGMRNEEWCYFAIYLLCIISFLSNLFTHLSIHPFYDQVDWLIPREHPAEMSCLWKELLKMFFLAALLSARMYAFVNPILFIYYSNQLSLIHSFIQSSSSIEGIDDSINTRTSPALWWGCSIYVQQGPSLSGCSWKAWFRPTERLWWTKTSCP